MKNFRVRLTSPNGQTIFRNTFAKDIGAAHQKVMDWPEVANQNYRYNVREDTYKPKRAFHD